MAGFHPTILLRQHVSHLLLCAVSFNTLKQISDDDDDDDNDVVIGDKMERQLFDLPSKYNATTLVLCRLTAVTQNLSFLGPGCQPKVGILDLLLTMFMVCLSVCLSVCLIVVGHDDELWQKGWTCLLYTSDAADE